MCCEILGKKSFEFLHNAEMKMSFQ